MFAYFSAENESKNSDCMSRNVGVLQHVLLPLFVQKDVLQMCANDSIVEEPLEAQKGRRRLGVWHFGKIIFGKILLLKLS